MNGACLGIILHSPCSATKITDHVASLMKQKIVEALAPENSKLAVLMDVVTASGEKSIMIVYMTAHFGVGDPEFSKSVTCALLVFT